MVLKTKVVNPPNEERKKEIINKIKELLEKENKKR